MTDQGKAQVAEWVWKLLTIIVAVLLAWGAVNARVSVLESRVDNQDTWLTRVEQKLDRALEQRQER